LQFKYETYSLFLNKEISSLDELDFDAVYIATGKGGNLFGLNRSGDGYFSTTRSGIFVGGSVAGADTMTAIAHGLNVVKAIETFLKIGSMSHSYARKNTKLPYEAIRVIPSKAVFPSTGEIYSKDEAMVESKRCLKCCCDACVYYSPLMDYFKKFPSRINEEVRVTLTPSSLDGHAKLATRLLSTCTHCGLCKEVCPKDIDTGEFLLQSHKTMRKQGAMPWAFHEFYLRDMEFSIIDAGISRRPKEYAQSGYMFFPGCQLGASNPQYVIRSYRFLLKHFPDTSLTLGCCGAPAEWAGDEKIHEEAIGRIREDWIKLGKPAAILVCPMCKQMFDRYLPEIKTEFLYDLMMAKGIGKVGEFLGFSASVYDPCASRHESLLQETIRNLSVRAGFQLEPLPMEGKLAECCSYGGHVAIAHPPYANNMINKRIRQKNTPYITYCSNCRDIFAAAGKQTWHILDILLGLGNDDANQLNVSDRRKNRLDLKKLILKEFWNEDVEIDNHKKPLEISQETREKLHKSYILESDLQAVIENCEQTGMKLYDPSKETFTGHMQIGKMTYWVEYRVKNDAYELLNGYHHRMKIEE
ncbi:MAG: hypothetical protein HQK55_15030, partial [Deltaproteobacteria bacterium]|nr:hypothetical protein [Deltaproteobacteria bacterium]